MMRSLQVRHWLRRYRFDKPRCDVSLTRFPSPRHPQRWTSGGWQHVLPPFLSGSVTQRKCDVLRMGDTPFCTGYTRVTSPDCYSYERLLYYKVFFRNIHNYFNK